MYRHANIIASIITTIISGQIHQKEDQPPPHMNQGPDQVSHGGDDGCCVCANARTGRLIALPNRMRKIEIFRHIFSLHVDCPWRAMRSADLLLLWG